MLVGGAHFEYRKASPEIVAKVEHIREIAVRYDVPVKAAALQFVLAHRGTAAVTPGASLSERIAEDSAALTFDILADLWSEMHEQQLVTADAPLPIDR
ncbi:MAG: Pyridoxal 4-dehydrogenase [Burkholderia lata]|uniref:Pyridoxal 4-dehydrogenase n=1 Tax=Burkholderia lata (strain ATCC 17760 / DSM 23089 / LMG 22485 / NCIMB 9086 / R18194 / 383) TaxID=482957 RepID=A0A833PFY1_BURL3|nr:MAG: Pyridoxal 4-dehydrogenase [Burkholderia lata]